MPSHTAALRRGAASAARRYDVPATTCFSTAPPPLPTAAGLRSMKTSVLRYTTRKPKKPAKFKAGDERKIRTGAGEAGATRISCLL